MSKMENLRKSPPESLMSIRSMRKNDLEAVVKVHMDSFAGFFLASLGPRFLGLLYRSMHEDSKGIILVSESDSEINGFVAGVQNQKGFYKRLLFRRIHKYAFAAMGPAFMRPSTIPRLLRAIGQPWRSRRSCTEACLLSLAVSPHSAGKGIGQELVQAFNTAMLARGVNEYSLTTDRDNNQRANRFYVDMGFKLMAVYKTTEGRAMNEYYIDLLG
jgi:ribosomal protein S18 acetylase RimI-like enzyme